ncbi:hypothetical protein MTR67_002660, partial [Solanum verrucosum]
VKKASISAIVITTLFYLCCSFFGYAAFGNDIPVGNLLTGFYKPFWLVDFANACIVLHLFGGYIASQYSHLLKKWAIQKYLKIDS